MNSKKITTLGATFLLMAGLCHASDKPDLGDVGGDLKAAKPEIGKQIAVGALRVMADEIEGSDKPSPGKDVNKPEMGKPVAEKPSKPGFGWSK